MRPVLLRSIAVVLAIGGALAGGLYLGKGGDLIATSVGPGGRERLEIYRPSRWQQWAAGHHDRDDAVARIANATTGETIAVSPVFYASGSGPVTWRRDGVDIGMAAHWDRATRNWQTD